MLENDEGYAHCRNTKNIFCFIINNRRLPKKNLTSCAVLSSRSMKSDVSGFGSGDVTFADVSSSVAFFFFFFFSFVGFSFVDFSLVDFSLVFFFGFYGNTVRKCS